MFDYAFASPAFVKVFPKYAPLGYALNWIIA